MRAAGNTKCSIVHYVSPRASDWATIDGIGNSRWVDAAESTTDWSGSVAGKVVDCDNEPFSAASELTVHYEDQLVPTQDEDAAAWLASRLKSAGLRQ